MFTTEGSEFRRHGLRPQDEISRSSNSSGQSSYLGSQDDPEADFEKGSTERMERLVSGLLQDEGRESPGDSFPVLPSSEVSSGSSDSVTSSSRGHSAALRFQELQMQYQDHCENNAFRRGIDDQGFDSERLRRNKGSVAGGRFPLSETVFPYEETHHQMSKAHEAGLRGSCTDTPRDNLNPGYFSYSQQNGAGTVNPQMTSRFQEQLTKLRDIEREYAVKKELEMESRNREYAATELQTSIEAMRNFNMYADSAGLGHLGRRENLLSNQEELVQDLRAIANNIEQTSLLERNTSWRANEAFMGLCKCCRQPGCQTSNVRSVESTRNCPSAEHVRFQQTSEPLSSSPRPTIVSHNSECPASATFRNAAVAVARSAASGPFSSGRRQETSNVRSSLGNTSQKKPDGFLSKLDLPPKRNSLLYGKALRGVQTSRRADNNMRVDFLGATGFHPRTPTSASPPIECVQNGHADISSFSSSAENETFHSFQKLLLEQKGSQYHAEFPGKDAGNTNGSSVRLQNTPATKVLIAQGPKSISILLKPENSAFRVKSSCPPSSRHSGSAAVPPTCSELPSPLRHRRLNKSDADTLLLIPIKRPSVELDVCNQGQFKTELCNNWQATQYCPYGDLCRFAHGVDQLRCVLRHPRYKTIPCRMIMHGKVCIYGHRCHFRHSLTTEELSLISIIDVHDASVQKRTV